MTWHAQPIYSESLFCIVLLSNLHQNGKICDMYAENIRRCKRRSLFGVARHLAWRIKNSVYIPYYNKELHSFSPRRRMYLARSWEKAGGAASRPHLAFKNLAANEIIANDNVWFLAHTNSPVGQAKLS